MPAQLLYPIGQNAVITFGDSGNTVTGTFCTFPLPSATFTATTNVSSTYVTSAVSWKSNKAKVGDYIWFYDDSTYWYDCRQIVSFSENGLIAIVDRPFSASHTAAECKVIRPLFCKVQAIIIPDSINNIIKVMGVPVNSDLNVGPVSMEWEKPADSHSAERNLLNPIIVNLNEAGSSKVVFTGTTY